MKKIITLAAAGALAATALNVQAQVTLDGVITAAEIGAAANAKYVSAGRFTTPHISNGGFGNWGLLQMYVANGNAKVNMALAGTVEQNGNAFELFVDLPNVTGAAQGQPLPAATPAVMGGSTVFDGPGDITGGNGGGIAQTRMDMQVDFALAMKGDAGGNIPQAIIYTSNTAATSRELSPVLPNTGAAITLAPTATVGSFSRLNGARMAYRAATGDITTNPGNPTGGAGAYGWEVELDRTALGLPAAPTIIRVMGAYVSGDGYWSSDVIPEIPGNANNNLARSPNFTTLPGTQAYTFNVALSTKAEDAASVAVGVFPNPSNSQATVSYQVLGRAQQVTVALTDLMGRTVRTLHSGIQNAGIQNVSLDNSNLAAGTYLVKVNVGEKVATRKVVLL